MVETNTKTERFKRVMWADGKRNVYIYIYFFLMVYICAYCFFLQRTGIVLCVLLCVGLGKVYERCD